MLKAKGTKLLHWEADLQLREHNAAATLSTAVTAHLNSLDTLIRKMERISLRTPSRPSGFNQESCADTSTGEPESSVQGLGKRTSAIAITPKGSIPKRARIDDPTCTWTIHGH